MSNTSQSYANGAALVTTDWVAANLNDPTIRLVEVNVDTAAYADGHIRNAAGWNWQTQLGDPVRAGTSRPKKPGNACFQNQGSLTAPELSFTETTTTGSRRLPTGWPKSMATWMRP